MARKPRLHVPGGFYPVILRGNAGETLFFAGADIPHLEVLLAEGMRRFGHRVHAYRWRIPIEHIIKRVCLAHIRGRARVALTQLLRANRRLLEAHLLKESFGHLWASRSTTWAWKFFARWVEQLKWSRLAPYQKFARMVERHLEGILASCDRPVSLGYIAGSNLKARNIIRRAYGYREEYMELKIIQGCSSLGVFRAWRSAVNI